MVRSEREEMGKGKRRTEKKEEGEEKEKKEMRKREAEVLLCPGEDRGQSCEVFSRSLHTQWEVLCWGQRENWTDRTCSFVADPIPLSHSLVAPRIPTLCLKEMLFPRHARDGGLQHSPR